MKNYKNFLITEDSDDLIIADIDKLVIHDLPYNQIIDICDLDIEISKETNQWEKNYCDYIKDFKDHPQLFNDDSYHFLIGIKNKKLVSLFYKQVGTDRNVYGDGFIYSTEKGSANEMFLEMKTKGSFTTFSNAENIASIKAQLKIGAEILCLSSNPPDKSNGAYNPDITNEKLLKLIQDEKIYYKDTYTNEEFFFLNKNNEIDISKLSNFMINNEDIKLIYPKDDKDYEEHGTGLKLYFYHK